ncbi:hypothetical protein Hanom_Chr15g01352731 [Helianthus anomalus]
MLFTQQKMFEHEHCTSEVIEYDMLLSEAIVDRDAPESGSSVDDKLRWLRSQIIGGFAEIQTPFGSRKLTYADHTASGRCLRYIEDYIIHNILPFYGNHTFVSLLIIYYVRFQFSSNNCFAVVLETSADLIYDGAT